MERDRYALLPQRIQSAVYDMQKFIAVLRTFRQYYATSKGRYDIRDVLGAALSFIFITAAILLILYMVR